MLSATLDNGLLMLIGTNQSDDIEISAGDVNGQVVVRGVDGVDDGTRFDDVDTIEIEGLGGHNTINVGDGIVDSEGTLVELAITTLGGRDRIEVGDNNAMIDTGDRRDTITVGNGNNIIRAGASRDRITVGNGINVIDAGTGSDRITLGDGINSITAGSLEDRIFSSGNVRLADSTFEAHLKFEVAGSVTIDSSTFARNVKIEGLTDMPLPTPKTFEMIDFQSPILEINNVRVFPGSGIAFDFQNPSTSGVFVSSEVSVTGLQPPSENSKIFISEYTADGSLRREVAVDDPDFDTVDGVELGGEVVVEGLSFFETQNLLLGGVTELEAEITDEFDFELEFSRIKEYEPSSITPVVGGVNFELMDVLAGFGQAGATFVGEFELEGLTFNPARDSVFATGELEGVNADGDVDLQFLLELDKTDGSVLNAFDLGELSEFAMHDAEGLGYNVARQSLLWVGNLEDDDEQAMGMGTGVEHSKLVEFSVANGSLDVMGEIDLTSSFGIGEAEGVSYDHTTGTLLIAESVGAPSVTIFGSTFERDLRIKTGGGEDLVQITDSVMDDLNIRTFRGIDRVDLSNVTVIDRADIATNHGDDDVTISDSSFRRLNIMLRRGNDTMSIGTTMATRWARLHGGLGRMDSLEDLGGNTLEELRIRTFEETVVTPGTEWSPIDELDVDGNGSVAARDAMLVINHMMDHSGGLLPPLNGAELEFYYDTSGDGFVAAEDAILVINHLIRRLR